MKSNPPRKTAFKPGLYYFLACLIVYALGVTLFVVWENNRLETELMSKIDSQLILAAKALKHMVAPDFHDRAVDGSSISFEEEMQNRAAISGLAFSTRFEWLYTLVEKDGRFYFAAPTVTEKEAGERERWYWLPYEDIPDDFVTAFRENRPVFVDYTDKWGTFRSVALPQVSAGGRRFLACADYDIGFVKGILKHNLVRSLTIALFFLILMLPFVLSFRTYYAELKQVNRELTVHRTELEGLVDTRTAELAESKERAEKELTDRHLAETRYRELFESSPIGILELEWPAGLCVPELQGNPPECDSHGSLGLRSIIGQVRLVAANKTAFVLLDGGESESFEEKVRTCLAEALPEGGREHLFKALRDRASHALSRLPDIQLERTMIRHNGEKRLIGLKLADIESAGPIRTIITLVDLTEHQKAEAKIKQARDEAEAANRSKGQFLANMSHEIRTPINGIIGMSELMADTPLEPNQAGFLDIINSEAETLLALINDILDFSKMEAGKLKLESIAFDIRELVENISETISHRALAKGLEFFAYISPAIKTLVVGDPVRFRQIIMNLAVNALKFTPKGEVSIMVEAEHDWPNDLELRIEVTDTGPGISTDKQQAIFEGFIQADASTTRKYGGTGLGITITKQLVELMGGRIDLQSTLGEGSTFRVNVRLPKHHGGMERPAPVPHNLNGMEILIVDDNRTNRRILAAYLQSAGAKTRSASNGLEALEHLTRLSESHRPVDLVLTDDLMPEMDGYTLAGEINSLSSDRAVPVIVLSSSGTVNESAVESGSHVRGHLHKPVRRDCLLREIARVMQKTGPLPARSKPVPKPFESCAIPAKILLVEDYPTNQFVALEHLRSAGFQVDLAENGQEAVEMFREKRYNIILMDVQMPVMDGFEATRIIRSLEDEKPENAGERVPIIAMTAHGDQGLSG